MKNFTLLLSSLLLGTMAFGQARIQAIHNCPDPSVATVDIWVENTLLLDDITYQSASAYMNVIPGTYTLYVTDATASGVAGYDPTVSNPQGIYDQSVTVVNGETYVAVASGGLAETGATAFELRVYQGQEGSTTAGNTDVNIIHSSYDSPEVNIYEANIPMLLASSLVFAQETGYVDLAATTYSIQVRLTNNTVIDQYTAPLGMFANETVVVLATGYTNPGAAVGTEPFGLMAVAEDGTVTLLPTESITPASVQVIHNSAAQDAAVVDVYLDNGATPLIDDFEFRTSTPFVDAPAGTITNIAVAPSTSASAGDQFFDKNFTFESSKKYIIVASGIEGSGTYNPATPFDLILIEDAQASSMTAGKVDVMVFHGITDAPVLDIQETLIPVGILASSINYGEAQGYSELDAVDHRVAIVSQGITLSTYQADLSLLADDAIVIVASGFLDPAVNEGGPVYGLWASLPTGGPLVELPNLANIEENEQIGELSVYPNPASNQLIISFDNMAEEQNISIVDVLGKTVYRESVNESGKVNKTVDISKLNNGIYVVKISSSKGATTKTVIVNK